MIQVYAPASIGNIGVGFDALGMAITPLNGKMLGDLITIEDSNVFNLCNAGFFYKQLPSQVEQSIVFRCWQKFCEIRGELCPISIRLEKNVPVASGLGSSACSIVATLIALNCYWKYPLNNDQLLLLMGEMEGEISGSVHFDNVSPCFLGGMRLILPGHELISQTIPSFSDWLWVVAYPGIAISTDVSRSILPQKYDLKDCVMHSKYLAGFIHACHSKQESLARHCMKDIIAEPYRSRLLPVDLLYLRNSVLEKGAVSCGISGSGPTLFALCNTMETAKDISEWLEHFYLQNSLGFVQICTLNNSGACIITE